MKKFIAIAFFLISVSTFAQEMLKSSEFQSKASEFQEKAGILYKKVSGESSYSSKGMLTVRLTPSIFTDIRSSVSTSCVEIWFNSDSGYTSFIDGDEIASCIEAIEYILSTEMSTSPSNDVEVGIITRGGVSIGAVYDSSKWYAYVRQLKYRANPEIRLDAAQLRTIMYVLKNSLTFFEGK